MKLLQGLQVNKAMEPDRLAPRVLKELAVEIAPILTVIYQKLIAQGALPGVLRKANILPIFKKGYIAMAGNYSTVSLTCIFSKLLEHIIWRHTLSQLEELNILHDCQHGFHNRCPCKTELITFVQDLLLNMSGGSQTDVILLDFSKAFDKVPHRRILTMFHYYGVRCSVVKVIETFLTTSHYMVLIDGEASDYTQVRSGVSLGLLLFLIFINDLPDEIVLKCEVISWWWSAIQKYQHQLGLCDAVERSRLLEWEDQWQMAFYPQKCKVLNVTCTRRPVHHMYHIEETELENVSHAAYLGAEINGKLTWTKHIDQTTAKVTQTLNFVHQNLHVASQNIKEITYNTLVRPSLDYACTVWDPYTQTQIDQVEMVQRWAARFVTKRYHNISRVTDRLADLKWETLQERRSNVRVVMMYKIAQCLVDMPIIPYIQPVQRATRHHNNQSFLQQSASTKYLQNSFFYWTMPAWNSLPAGIVELGNIDLFKACLAWYAMPVPM